MSTNGEREIIIEQNEESTFNEPVRSKRNDLLMPVSNVNTKAQVFLEYIYGMDDDTAREDLCDLIDQFLAQDQQSGDADDFHNFAVELARKDEYILACKVLDCGLELFPKNVDLLADYLQYGVSCNKIEECKKVYKTLIKIPKRRWTWRGFAFLIDYLQFLIDRSDSDKEIDAKEEEMIEIASDFRNRFPYSEESYRVEASVYHILAPEKETDILKKALDNVKVAPKCALRYADIMFERGFYEEAAEAISRGISDATQTQSSVNEGYIYYLSALCKIAVIQKKNKDFVITKEEAEDIYSDFNIALSRFRETRSSYTDVIITKTNAIVNKSGQTVDPKFDLLYDSVSQ